MPLLDSFKVDHKKMKAPAVRVAKTMTSKHNDTVTVFDLGPYPLYKDGYFGRFIFAIKQTIKQYIGKNKLPSSPNLAVWGGVFIKKGR